jgi:hypothetical protein
MNRIRTKVLLASLLNPSCIPLSSSLDALGRESSVTETQENATDIQDDKIADKHPVYDPERVVDDPGDAFSFVDNHLGGIGVCF